MQTMEDCFEEFLIQNGYSIKTPSGEPSTVDDYINRIKKVCKDEKYTWIQLAANIDAIVTLYDIGGAKQLIGSKSHNAVINALKRFQEFVNLFQ